MRILIVHSDLPVRTSLQALAAGAQYRVDSFSDAASFLAALPTSEPACLILGTDLPDMDGLQLQSLLAGRADLPVIFVADRPSVRTVVQAMKAGAMEVLTTPIDEPALLGAIRQGLQLSAERWALQQRYEQLSPREREVMQLVIRGRANKYIAAELGITEFTVKIHRGKVMRKMQADSLPHLVRLSARLSIQQLQTQVLHVESDRSTAAGIARRDGLGVRGAVIRGGGSESSAAKSCFC